MRALLWENVFSLFPNSPRVILFLLILTKRDWRFKKRIQIILRFFNFKGTFVFIVICARYSQSVLILVKLINLLLDEVLIVFRQHLDLSVFQDYNHSGDYEPESGLIFVRLFDIFAIFGWIPYHELEKLHGNSGTTGIVSWWSTENGGFLLFWTLVGFFSLYILFPPKILLIIRRSRICRLFSPLIPLGLILKILTA